MDDKAICKWTQNMFRATARNNLVIIYTPEAAPTQVYVSDGYTMMVLPRTHKAVQNFVLPEPGTEFLWHTASDASPVRPSSETQESKIQGMLNNWDEAATWPEVTPVPFLFESYDGIHRVFQEKVTGAACTCDRRSTEVLGNTATSLSWSGIFRKGTGAPAKPIVLFEREHPDDHYLPVWWAMPSNLALGVTLPQLAAAVPHG